MPDWVTTTHIDRAPERCAVFPQIGNHTPGAKFIDTLVDLPGHDTNRVYVSYAAARKLGEHIGMVAKSTLEDAATKLAFSEAEVRILEERVKELEADGARYKDAFELIKYDIKEVTPGGRVKANG